MGRLIMGRITGLYIPICGASPRWAPFHTQRFCRTMFAKPAIVSNLRFSPEPPKIKNPANAGFVNGADNRTRTGDIWYHKPTL